MKEKIQLYTYAVWGAIPLAGAEEQLWFHEAQIYVISELVFVNKFKKMGGFSADRRAKKCLTAQRLGYLIFVMYLFFYYYYWKNTPVGNGIQYHAVKWHVAQFHYRTHKTRTLILRPLGTCHWVASFGEKSVYFREKWFLKLWNVSERKHETLDTLILRIIVIIFLKLFYFSWNFSILFSNVSWGK